MSLPILYSFRRCPYAIRARLGIAFSQQVVELREVVLKDKPAAMLAVSPKATVPVLVCPDGRVIDESRDIVLWALHQNDKQGLLSNNSAYDEMRALVEQNDHDFKYWLDRYKYADRYPDQPQSFYRENAECFLHSLEKYLQAENYLFGEGPSFADISIMPFVRQFSMVDSEAFDEMHYPKVKQWLSSWLCSPVFLSIMSKYTQWQVNSDPILLDVLERESLVY